MTKTVADLSGNGKGVSYDLRQGHYQRHIVKHFLEDFGMNGGVNADPVVNDKAIKAALAEGVIVRGRAYGVYPVTKTVVVSSNACLIGDGSTAAKPAIYMQDKYFNNQSSLIGSRYGTNAVGLDLSNTSDVVLENFGVYGDQIGGRQLRPIVARTCIDLNLIGVDVTHFATAVGITLAGISGDSRVQDCYISDFYDNSATFLAGTPQLTGLEVDNDFTVNTTQLRVSGLGVKNLIAGPAFITVFGYETDGMNVVSRGATGISLDRFDIRGVGEGVDWFGSHGRISNGYIQDCYLFGLKFVHGASYNVATGMNIRRAGIAGITLQGTVQVDADVRYNNISNCVVSDIDPNGVFVASDSSCINFGQDYTQSVKNNLVTNCLLDEGALGKYGVLNLSGATGNNHCEGMKIVAGAANVRRVLVTAAGGNVQLAGADTYYTDLV